MRLNHRLIYIWIVILIILILLIFLILKIRIISQFRVCRRCMFHFFLIFLLIVVIIQIILKSLPYQSLKIRQLRKNINHGLVSNIRQKSKLKLWILQGIVHYLLKLVLGSLLIFHYFVLYLILLVQFMHISLIPSLLRILL